MIQVQDISLTLGGHTILDRLSWSVPDGGRVGLIGANGAGKTTLLRILAGQLDQDSGTVAFRGTPGYLAQDVEESTSERSVLDQALSAFDSLLELQSREASLTGQLTSDTADHAGLIVELESVQAEMAIHEVHTMRSRAETVLMGLGFNPEDMGRPLESLSGGYRMRVALARILLQEPDLLLLDEPTNHLDILSIDWLEQYLRTMSGTVILVSHDRYFLNRMTTSTAHLYRGRITTYAGNYDFFVTERDKRRVLEQAAYDNQQREILQTERFIRRFRYKASKARQVQSRIKYLDKLERLHPPEPPETQVRIRVPVPRSPGRIVLKLSQFAKSYAAEAGPPVQVFSNAGPLTIERGEKVALVGRNGAGKSTLARILLGSESLDGERTEGHNVEISFFAQNQAESLNPAQTVLESLQHEAVGRTDVYLRTLLGAFLFSGDDVFKPVAVLSGGEKSRLALAGTLVNPANCLILDEPTNHLDIASIHVLIEALRQFQGTLVLVSHDRHFLDQVANTIWHVGNGQVVTYRGTYSEYRWACQHGSLRRAQTNAAPRPPERPKRSMRTGGPKSRDQKRREAEARNRAYRLARQSGDPQGTELTPRQREWLCEQAETAIADAESRKASLERSLADPDVYREPDRAKQASEDWNSLERELEKLYEQWESLMADA